MRCKVIYQKQEQAQQYDLLRLLTVLCVLPIRAAVFLLSLNYLTKEVLRVVDQLSPGATVAAAGFSSHLMEPDS